MSKHYIECPECGGEGVGPEAMEPCMTCGRSRPDSFAPPADLQAAVEALRWPVSQMGFNPEREELDALAHNAALDSIAATAGAMLAERDAELRTLEEENHALQDSNEEIGKQRDEAFGYAHDMESQNQDFGKALADLAAANARIAARAANARASGPWRPIADLPDGIPAILLERDDGWIKIATWEEGVYVTHVCDLEGGGCDYLEITPDNYRHFAEIRRPR